MADSRIAEAIARWLTEKSMPALAMLKTAVDARVQLEHRTPR